tara:strand:+ start:1892 stop:2674 length:783 start_codon:yes stop_codon:yes gene_type:complete
MNASSSKLKWVDNHCHFEESDEVAIDLQEAAAEGVEKFIVVGTDLETSLKAKELSQAYAGKIFATAGIHPHEAIHGACGIEELLSEDMVVAVGECGFDFYYDHSPHEEQEKVFREQISLAHKFNLPLIIHTREAWSETFKVLDEMEIPSKTVFHCFTGGPHEAELALERGAYLSFSGIVTFKNADSLREALRITPLERIMIETDSPYLTPEPNRGKRNRPKYLPHIGNRIAKELNTEPETIADAAWLNTHHFYSLTHNAN